MQPSTLTSLPSVQKIYSLVTQFPIEQQLTIAEHIKKQALAAKVSQSWKRNFKRLSIIILPLAKKRGYPPKNLLRVNYAYIFLPKFMHMRQ